MWLLLSGADSLGSLEILLCSEENHYIEAIAACPLPREINIACQYVNIWEIQDMKRRCDFD